MADPTPRPRFQFDVVDTARGILTLGGVGLVGYGAWLHYPPLGFITGGALLVAVGVIAVLRAR